MNHTHESAFEPALFLVENIKLLPKGRVLDIAMGAGRNAIYLAKLGFDVEGVEISFMILERRDGTHRVSFRSSGKYTVNDVAQTFNGGGHKFAAGARINKLSTLDVERDITRQLADKIEGEF